MEIAPIGDDPCTISQELVTCASGLFCMLFIQPFKGHGQGKD